ncbi:hypothetical protein J4N37_08905 [Vibrio sp. SCSIO 43153]|uniref:Uracil-DNA glycosylase-like domain-containing protein n=1 Tax=Vibrio sp. DAT722 TaxID=344879 RepID=Q2F9Y6_9VIBR|nr:MULTISPECIES: hypothetical protein [Vibrio]ABA55885.1 hypothetical protein [Vibrio sp. DAT722]USD48750.1 hypothetical protein J4N37_08905 [Vibrio sp. SCSIO 43153]
MDIQFEEWKSKDLHKGKLFITDGIIKEELWLSSPHKVMFLLKEAYDSRRESGSWDLPKLINKRGVSGRTFKPMAQWAYGIHKILDGHGIVPFVEKGDDVKNALLSSAIVNLKKSSGKKSSSQKDLMKYVDEDWELIRSQICSIAPQVVVCGKTWSLISGKLDDKVKISDRAYISNGIIYINYWHPSNRSSNVMNYYALCSIVEMAIKASVKLKL